MDIFEYATRNKLRYPSTVGELTTEQLWDLPLTSKTKPNLDNIARAINTELIAITEQSFVNTSSDPRKPLLTNALEVVKYIIAFKQDEAKARAETNAKAERKAQLLEALADREKADLTSKTKEQLLEELNSL